jgi:glutathione S-transferase
LAQRGLARLQRLFETLEARLEGWGTVAGTGLSVADITAVVAVDFARVVRVVRVRPDDRHPNLLRWHAAMALGLR